MQNVTMSGLAIFALTMATSAVLTGCAEAPERGPNPCNAQACDVREEECQEHVMEIVHCFRGGDERVMPDVRVITEDEYVDIVRGEEPTEEEELSYERFTRAMHLLELAPEERDQDATIEEYASEIAAAYLTDEKNVVLIDRGKPLDSMEIVATFAHELVHALQDEEVDLAEFYETSRPSLDGALATRALIEGEAELYGVLTYAALQGVRSDFIDWYRHYVDYQITMLLNGYKDEAPLALTFVRFPYAFGGYYVTDAWLGGGQRSVKALFEDPPQSTADVITVTALNEDAQEDVAMFREESKLGELEGWELVTYDELGSFVIDNFLHRMEVSGDEALDVRALQVLADGVTVLYNEETDKVAVVWRMHFEPEGVLDQAAVKALRKALEAPDEDAPEPADDVTARVFADDRDVYIFASDGPLPAEWLGDALTWEPAPLDEEMEEEMPTAARWRQLGQR